MRSDEPTKLWNSNFIRITVVSFCLFCGFQMFPTALPVWIKSLGGDDAILGWVTLVFTISTLIARPLAGGIMDVFGRKRVFMAGLVVMLAATILHYFFPIIGVILVLRFILGAGWGVSSTGSGAIVTGFIPKARFGEGMGFFSLAASLALGIAPAVALSLPVNVMIWVSAGILFVSLALSTGLPAATPAQLAPPVESGGRIRWPALYERASIVPSLVMMLTTVTYGATFTFIAVFGLERGVANIGPFFTVYAAVMILTRPLIGRVIDRKGFGVVIVPGAASMCLAFLIISQASALWVFLSAAPLYAIGQGCIQTSTQTLAVLNAPRDRAGAANATFYTGFDLGIGIGAMFGGFLASFLGYGPMFGVLAFVPLLAAVLYLVTARLGLKQLPPSQRQAME